MKNRSLHPYARVSIVPLLLLLPALAAGCATEVDDAEVVGSEAAPVDEGVLENALLHESQFAQAGYELEGRAWLSPEISLSFYVDAEQNHVFSTLMRAGADVKPDQM